MFKFKAGDYVEGISNNYGITDKKMYMAQVIEINEKNNEMRIRILKHEKQNFINDEYWVGNSCEDFKLVCKFEQAEEIENNNVYSRINEILDYLGVNEIQFNNITITRKKGE